MGVALSVVKYLSNSFHSVKVSLLLFFLQTWSLLIFFYCLLLYLPLISTFQNLLILHAFFPLYVFPPLNFSQTILYHCSLDPLLCFPLSVSILPPPPNPHSSEYILHLAVVLHKHSRASCMAAYVRKANFSHGAAGENWDSLCPPRDAICPCRRTC